VDLILMGNRRPLLMFTCFLLGGMGLALTIGLLDVFVVHADAIQDQGSASAGLDLALGIPLLIIGMLLATGHLHGRRPPPRISGRRRAAGHSGSCTSPGGGWRSSSARRSARRAWPTSARCSQGVKDH
jgi:hypothetical protein